MRLKKIKLAGFKSFVDQTTIELKGNVTAIVGPNGCGKSNVIDAVRWVMGESSAKQLRGLSMTDVIFNGSEKRKPVGMASIELIFDNSDASLGGEYAKYSEIAICRKVARDGLSDYYFNNTRCRRRDIVDLFLGTGLGPDSYAIIEQGTISQFVEAKPDELRVYLEEAAGISKYKERRRETETRMKHTRENLARLNDIRSEVELQLKHLKSQANSAERYKKLKHEEQLSKAQLHALHWRDLSEKLRTLEQTIGESELKLEEKITAQRDCETKIVKLREQHADAINLFNTTQERYYKIGANVARLEQQIHHEKERKKNLALELTKAEHLSAETLQHKNTDQQQIVVLQTELATLTQEKSSAAKLQQIALQAVEEASRQMQESSRVWDEFNLEVSKIERNAEVEYTKIQHLQQNRANEERQLVKLRNELTASIGTNMQDELADLERRQEEAKKSSNDVHRVAAEKQQEIARLREQNDRTRKELDEIRSKLQVLKGKSASLEALQQAALGQNNKEMQSWLQTQKLNDKPRLVSEVKVESGFEKAVEAVLGTYLEAIAVEELNLFTEFPGGNLILFENKSFAERQINTPTKNQTGFPLLLQKLETSWNVSDLLAGIYVADNLSQAQEMRKNLECHESIITKDGLWVGKNWLCSNFGSKQKVGVLQRERELKELKKALHKEQDNATKKEQEIMEQQDLLVAAEKSFQELQHQLREATTALGKLQGEMNAKQSHIADLQQRHNNLALEINQYEAKLVETKHKLEEMQKNWQETVAKKQELQEKRQHFSKQRDESQQQLNAARENLAEQRKASDTSVMRSEMLQTQISYLQQSQTRADKRLQDLKAQCENIRAQLLGIDAPLLAEEKELSAELAIRFVVENELQIAKQKVGADEHLLRELEQQREALQNESQKLRNNLENIRIEAQGLKTKSAMQKEQASELDYEVDKLLTELEPGMSVLELEDRLIQVISKIERLGAINLAAIEEFAQQQQRKDYLEAQNQDLVSALTTLENAIRKIDQETKAKFQDIFTKVNQRFQEIFPKIFNGGKAMLQLVNESDVLTTGVTIAAQPPGKRNSSIHLLSGGEKALTAVALVFAIFQQNPAPFCMLDEVDAPLDDSNVMRFCNLMKEMANEVQLIFISHNKLTLQIADQLTGVTMQEPGVSRIVAVDIDEALKMAEK